MAREFARRMIGLNRDDYPSKKLCVEAASATWRNGYYARLLLVGCGFDAALGFDFLLNKLGFLCVIRDGVEWW